jgi:hypothetical protein
LAEAAEDGQMEEQVLTEVQEAVEGDMVFLQTLVGPLHKLAALE